MFDVGHTQLRNSLKVTGNPQKSNNFSRLLGKAFVNFKSVRGVDLGHFKVML